MAAFTFTVQVWNAPSDLSWHTDRPSGINWRQDNNRYIWIDTVVGPAQIQFGPSTIYTVPPTVQGYGGFPVGDGGFAPITVDYGAGPGPPPTNPTPPGGGVCVRTAWLDLDGDLLALENEAAGYFCTSFDLGSPTVREVTNNRPDRDGNDDRTQYLGPRAIAVDITALAGAGAWIDDVASSFGPYMIPSVRPILHYILDRPAAPERIMTVRGASYDYAVAGDNQRDIKLQFVAADPVAYDPDQQSVTVWTGGGTAPGRTYPLTFPRVYPAGSGPGATSATITPAGDFPIRPLVRFYGPATAPTAYVWIYGYPPGAGGTGRRDFYLQLVSGVSINAATGSTSTPTPVPRSGTRIRPATRSARSTGPSRRGPR